MDENFLDKEEQIGLLEGLLSPVENALEDGDMVEACLYVYGKEDGYLSSKQLLKKCNEEFKGKADENTMQALLSRMVSSKEMVVPGYIDIKRGEDGENLFGVTDKGLAYLWGKLVKRNSDDIFDKFGKVIAINKKLNDPDRDIESHDLYALILLAVMRIRKDEATATDVRKIIESWVTPTGKNAEPLESELKYENPLTRFGRKFHNVFSSHKVMFKKGLIEMVDGTSATWRVTDKGKAVLIKRIQKDRRNLMLQMKNAAVQESLENNVLALHILSRYLKEDDITPQQNDAIGVVFDMINSKVEKDNKVVAEIASTLSNPETSTHGRSIKKLSL